MGSNRRSGTARLCGPGKATWPSESQLLDLNSRPRNENHKAWNKWKNHLRISHIPHGCDGQSGLPRFFLSFHGTLGPPGSHYLHQLDYWWGRLWLCDQLELVGQPQLFQKPPVGLVRILWTQSRGTNRGTSGNMKIFLVLSCFYPHFHSSLTGGKWDFTSFPFNGDWAKAIVIPITDE